MKRIVMKNIAATTVFLATVVLASTVGATTKGRIIPTGSVTFHKDGQLIAKFSGQAPINDSAIINCNKACSVRLDGMSLNVAGDTTFALKDAGDSINLFVKEGLVTFNVSNVNQQISFYTPDGRYVKSEGFIAPTSSHNGVKGFMNVTSSQAQIGVNQGGMILSTANGVQTIDSGYTYTINLNDLPAPSAGGQVPVVETTGNAVGYTVGGLLIGGTGLWAGLKFNDSDDDGSFSPGR